MGRDIRFPSGARQVNSNKYGMFLWTPWEDGMFLRAPRDAWMNSNVFRADFGSGLICPRTQTCCAELRRLARLANSPGFKSFRCPRERIKFSLERFSDPSLYSLRAQPLESSLGRVPQAADDSCNKNFRKLDRVGRRGLSEPREDFSRLLTYAFPRLFPLPFSQRKITAESESRSQ